MMKDERLEALTDKQRLWVEHYLECLNATEAARRAGYKAKNGNLRHLGYTNLHHEKIRPILDDAFAERVMSESEGKSRVALIARGDIGDLEEALKERTPSAIVAAAKRKGVSHLIKRVSRTQHGITVEVYDGLRALEMILKTHGALTEKHEHSGEIDLNGT